MDLAAVYSRRIDNRTLTLAPSGWTYRNTFVLYDKETETLWYPYAKGLMGIQGFYFKRWLPLVESADTQWEQWRVKHPESAVLQ